MSTVGSIKNEMHIASPSDLLVLKDEADQMVVNDSSLLPYFLDHVYREYNKKRFYESAGANMITPYDGGFRPTTYSPAVSVEAILLETGGTDYILLEDGTELLLE